MMQLSCKDMGNMDCDFVAQGETMDEVMAMGMDHAKAVHGMTDADMAPEKMEMMKAAVKTV